MLAAGIYGHFSPPEWEVCIGAVLTQNTNWGNVELALRNMKGKGIISREDIKKIKEKDLAGIIRPAGYYNQKAKKLKILASFSGKPARDNLLGLWGLGPETVDSILLYAYNRPYFVIDAYTKRVFSRLGVKLREDYEEWRNYFESRLPRDVNLYKEFHALIVELAKNFCKKRPECRKCPLSGRCRNSQTATSSADSGSGQKV